MSLRMWVRSQALLSELRIQRCRIQRCGVDCRCSSDPAMLWLWSRAAAAAPIRPLAWELPYAAGAAFMEYKQTNRQNTGFGVRQTTTRRHCIIYSKIFDPYKSSLWTLPTRICKIPITVLLPWSMECEQK